MPALSAAQRALKIKFLVLDIDGVLTNGQLVYNANSQEIKFFDVKDGYGLKLLMYAGIEVALLSSRSSAANRLRAAELGILELKEDVKIKMPVFQELLSTRGLLPERAAYMGDDLIDLPTMCIAGLALAPADAVAEVRRVAHLVARYPGGRGAVRQICEFILRTQGFWKL